MNKEKDRVFDISFQAILWVAYLLYKCLLPYLPVINQQLNPKRSWKRYHAMRLRIKQESSLSRCQEVSAKSSRVFCFRKQDSWT